jgi:hypothetical protein
MLRSSLCYRTRSPSTEPMFYPVSVTIPPAPPPHIFYVSPQGDDSASGLTLRTPFRTPQHAADLTRPGDTVLLLDGTYTSPASDVLTIHNPGSPAAWITFAAAPGAHPILRGGPKTWMVVRVVAPAAYIEVRGLTVIGNLDNVTLAQAQAVQADPAHHPEVNGSGIGVDGSPNASRAADPVAHPHHVRILQSTVSNCPGGGIGTEKADYVTIASNTIFRTSWYSSYGNSAISSFQNFDTNPADTATQYKVVITGNTIYQNQELVPTGQPPAITDGEAIIIDSNKNRDFPAGGNPDPPYTGRTLIANNVAFANGSSAIEVFASAHVDVVNNSTYANVLGPALTGKGELNLNLASDVRVLNNIFVSRPGQNPISVTTPCTGGCVLDYNLTFGGKNILLTPPAGPHDLAADPLYQHPETADPAQTSLKLQPASPAIASGTATLAPTTDITGKPRSANAITRGAYQQ